MKTFKHKQRTNIIGVELINSDESSNGGRSQTPLGDLTNDREFARV